MNEKKKQVKEYSFQDYDPVQQLIAVLKIVRQLISCLNVEEKAFDNTDYSKINDEYRGDLYADDLCELGFLDVAVSHSAIAIFAPYIEGLCKHEFAALQANGRSGIPTHMRTNQPYFWCIQYHVNNEDQKQKGIAKGIFQMLEALDILKHFPENTEKMLEIIFSFRNYVMHNGFEAKIEERIKFIKTIKANNWEAYFSWSTTDNEPRMVSLKKEFLNTCLTFCKDIKEGFEKEKA